MNPTARKTLATVCTLVAVALVASAPALALAPKEARDQLDLLVTIDPSLRVVEVNVDATGFNGPLPGAQAMQDFRAEHGTAWRFTVDLRRGVTSLLDGGAIPFIPGNANDLAWEDFAPGCSSYDCLPVSTVEALARRFIDANAQAPGLRPADLVGAIANETGISAREIGAIEIEERFSLVEISDHIAEDVVRALRGTSLRGQRVTVRKDQPKRSTK